MSLITTQSELETYAATLASAAFVCLDTEFLRESTYFPQLCLIQSKIPGGPAVAIDALAQGLDLAPFWAAIANPRVLKIFHSGRQDLEIIAEATGAVPQPLFDTQIAASVLGYGEQVGFESLARQIASVQLDKGSQFTDWSRRPLTPRQITYALGDVEYLEPIYLALSKKLRDLGRESWVAEDVAILGDIKTYQLDPFELWRRVRIKSDKPRDLAVLRSVAAWRETMAKSRNLPRGRVIKDDPLGEIALHHPRNLDELCAIRGLDKGMAKGKWGPSLLDAIAQGLAVPESDCPRVTRKKGLSDEQELLLDILKFIVRMRARELGLAPRLLASADDLEQVVREGIESSRLANGWRYDAIGKMIVEQRHFGFDLDLKGRRVTLITA